jgi:transposase
LIALKLNQRQRNIFTRFLKDARKTYNLAVAYVQEQKLIVPEERMGERLSQTQLSSLLEKKFIPQVALAGTPHASLLWTPKVIRQQALRRLCATVEAYYTKVKKRLKLRAQYPHALAFQKPIKFQLKFKTKKIVADSFYVEHCSLQKTSDFTFSCYRRFKDGRGCKENKTLYPLDALLIQGHREPLKDSMFEKDTGFTYQNGKWYFMAPVAWEPRVLPVSIERDRLGAIDPGLRKFATVYSPEGQVKFYGTNTQKVIRKHLRRIDKHKKRRTHLYQQHKRFKRIDTTRAGRRSRKKKRRQALRKQRDRYYEAEAKMKNTVKNMHYRVSHELCRSFETLIHPTFSSSSCVKKQGRRLSKEQVRICQALGFYKFRQRLKETASKYGTKIYKGSEAYTSKQCGHCGFLNDKLGASEVFNCHNCQAIGDRDAHAARNIALRFLKCQVCFVTQKTSCSDCIVPVCVTKQVV